METSIHIANEQAMEQLGAKLATQLRVGDLIFLQGELGAGKTTLVRGILHGLGYSGTVKSPTYTIVEPYEINHYRVYHFDLYRIHDPQELLEIGVSDYLAEDALVLIEWPEKAMLCLPEPTLWAQIDLAPTGRQLTWRVASERGKAILSAI